MVAEKTDAQRLHFEHKLWENELKFFADEIGIYEHRLEDMVKRHDSAEVLARLEQFQNQFILQKSVLAQMRHDIKIHEQTISNMLKAGFSKPEHKMDDHTTLRDQMDSFRKIYSDMKAGFYAYLLEWK